MARAALGWGISELANAADLFPEAVAAFERGDRLDAASLEGMRRALERAGVVFLAEEGDGPGVRLGRGVGTLDSRIEDGERALARPSLPSGPSPEKGMDMLRRGLAENDLRDLKQQRRARGRRPTGEQG